VAPIRAGRCNEPGYKGEEFVFRGAAQRIWAYSVRPEPAERGENPPEKVPGGNENIPLPSSLALGISRDTRRINRYPPAISRNPPGNSRSIPGETELSLGDTRLSLRELSFDFRDNQFDSGEN
jgi:hypothetical protein